MALGMQDERLMASAISVSAHQGISDHPIDPLFIISAWRCLFDRIGEKKPERFRSVPKW